MKRFTGGQCLGDCGSSEFFSGPLGGEAMTRVPLCPELDKQGRKWVNLRLIARRKRNQKLARETALTQAKREQNARYSKTGPRYWKAHFAAVWPRRVFCLLITSCFFFLSFMNIISPFKLFLRRTCPNSIGKQRKRR